MRLIDTATQVCAVIGDPVEHSLSPLIHNAAFDAAGLNFVYTAFRVADVKSCLAGMRAMEGFRGMSVTIPHKVAVVACLDFIDALAAKVGSVNTILHEGGKLYGSTTDGPGTLRAFAGAGIELAGKKVLFLGAGGAVRAVAFAVADVAHPAEITILGRNMSRLSALANDLKSKTAVSVRTGTLADDIETEVPAHDVLIQGTPTGMYPSPPDASLVPQTLLRPHQVVFDMVYRPLKTRLLAEAESAGCRVISGGEMLVQQAGLQFELWTGRAAPLDVMRDTLLRALGNETDATFQPQGG